MEKIIVLERRNIQDLSDILRLAHTIGKKVFGVEWVKVAPTVYPLKDKHKKVVGYTVKVSPDNNNKKIVERGKRENTKTNQRN